MKKLIAVFLVCILLITVLFVTGCDEHPSDQGNGDKGGNETGDNGYQETSSLSDFKFELNDDGDSYCLVSYNGTASKAIIPSTYLGKPVTSIGDCAFYKCSSLTSVTIGNSVTSIGNYAFCECSSLTSITIPDSVTSIGNYAFCECISLTSITIPDSVTSISENAFCNCISLTNITIGNGVTNIGSYAFYNCYKLLEVYNLSSLNIIAGLYDNGYVGYYALGVYTDINTPSKLWTNSDGYTFYENGDTCYLVWYTGYDSKLTLPDNCNGKNYAINKNAFYNCSNLTSVTIPNSVTNIGSSAFWYCSRLTSITIPNSIMRIRRDAFCGCSKLTSVTFEDTSTWYITENSDMTGETEIDVTDASKNAGYLKSDHYDEYWYKK